MITFEADDGDGCQLRVVVNRDDMTADELVAEFKTFMLAIGYHPKSVDDALGIDDIYGTAA